MSASHIALLPDRGVVSVTGAEAHAFLDNLITNDMDLLKQQPAIHAGLLTPQGKILFAFFVVRHGEGFLLETSRATAADLVKRLTLYRLRAKVAIGDASADWIVAAAWGGAAPDIADSVVYPDPRAEGLGHRLIVPVASASTIAGADDGREDYDRHRIAAGVPEAGRDYALGDTFPHEADFDVQAGVSFTKGCFVGQEVVARMQHKTVVRKRVVRIKGDAPLTAGHDILVGEAAIGSVGSVDGTHGLALLRVDRALEAREKEQALIAGGTKLSVEPEALDRYAAAKARATGAS